MQMLYRHTTTIQTHDYYTDTQLLYRHTTTIQAHDYYTDTTTIQTPTYYKEAQKTRPSSDDYTMATGILFSAISHILKSGHMAHTTI